MKIIKIFPRTRVFKKRKLICFNLFTPELKKFTEIYAGWKNICCNIHYHQRRLITNIMVLFKTVSFPKGAVPWWANYIIPSKDFWRKFPRLDPTRSELLRSVWPSVLMRREYSVSCVAKESQKLVMLKGSWTFGTVANPSICIWNRQVSAERDSSKSNLSECRKFSWNVEEC